MSPAETTDPAAGQPVTEVGPDRGTPVIEPDPAAGMHVIEVGLGDRSYPVVVGDGAVSAVAGLVPGDVRRATVVTQEPVRYVAETVAGSLGNLLGSEPEVVTIAGGEGAKTLSTVEELTRRWVRAGLNRRDLVVSVGGGVVSDVVGFAASVYHRGTRVLHVSTTLLGQVDAAIGGKTGVNLPEGKNLVGAFWQPTAVVCDTATLATLPPRELASGMGEVAKYHFLGGGELLDPTGDGARTMDMATRVAVCVGIKASVVAADERESGSRATLNYGHTLAHALEIAGGFDLRHGEAVAIGLIYAAEVARALGRIDDRRVAEHRRVVAAHGLPDRIPGGLDPEELLDLFGRDKKALSGVTLVLDGPAGVETVTGIDPGVLRGALDAVL